MPKAQSAVEFIFLASFMLLVIVGFFAVTSSKTLEAQEEGNKKIAETIADLAYKEIEIAQSVNDGYVRYFVMPPTANGVDYSIQIIDDRELVVNYAGYEFVKFIASNVSGNISKGVNRIAKENGIVYLRNYAECDDLTDNDGDNLVDLNDPGCDDKTDNDESNCGDARCEGFETCSNCATDCGICPTIGKFLLKNSLFNVMSFENTGNVILRGTLAQNPSPQQTADDEFVVKNSAGGNVAVLNLVTGNMVISGTLNENQGTLSPSAASNDFVINDPSGDVISYIDESGNFFIKGTLTQNGNP
jgi:hypothetical protein